MIGLGKSLSTCQYAENIYYYFGAKTYYVII